MNENLTHAYVHRLAAVHFAGFAPAFPLSLHDRKYARKPPVPIASVVSGHAKNKKYEYEKTFDNHCIHDFFSNCLRTNYYYPNSNWTNQ